MAFLYSTDNYTDKTVEDDETDEIKYGKGGNDYFEEAKHPHPRQTELDRWLMAGVGTECYRLPDNEVAQLYYVRARMNAYKEKAARTNYDRRLLGKQTKPHNR